jgi:CRP-like cAMP-binding protein
MQSDRIDFLELFAQEPRISLKAGEVLFSAGSKADAMYVILAGAVVVCNGPVIYEEVRKGGIVGEMAIVDDLPRSATVKATTDTILTKIDKPLFVSTIQRTPQFAVGVMKVMAHRLRVTTQKLAKAG